MNFESVVTTVKGEPIIVRDIISHLKLKGFFRQAIYELIERCVVRMALKDRDLAISEAEMADRVAKTRQALGVEDESNFSRYLHFYGSTEEQWRDFVRKEAEFELLKQSLITSDRVNEYFRRDPLRFASVSIARIACRAREEAEMVVSAARDGRRDFVELAKCFSADDSTRLSGGFIGNVKRGMLPPQVEVAAFAATENQILGPFHEVALWTVYKIHAVNVPKLDDTLRKVIRDQMFSEWLREQVLTVPA